MIFENVAISISILVARLVAVFGTKPTVVEHKYQKAFRLGLLVPRRTRFFEISADLCLADRADDVADGVVDNTRGTCNE